MNGPNRPDRWRIDMNEQEQLKQLKEEYENMTIPEAGRERLQAGIDRARMEKKRAEHARRRSAWTAVAAAAVGNGCAYHIRHKPAEQMGGGQR